MNADGFLSDSDYSNYLDAFKEANKDLRYPNLLVLLNGSPDLARDRIAKRGRSEEMGLVNPANKYLENLHELYRDFLSIYGGNCMVIEASHDILNSAEEREKVLKLIKSHTPGLNHDKILINPPSRE